MADAANWKYNKKAQIQPMLTWQHNRSPKQKRTSTKAYTSNNQSSSILIASHLLSTELELTGCCVNLLPSSKIVILVPFVIKPPTSPWLDPLDSKMRLNLYSKDVNHGEQRRFLNVDGGKIRSHGFRDRIECKHARFRHPTQCVEGIQVRSDTCDSIGSGLGFGSTPSTQVGLCRSLGRVIAS
jgi:hypothetical protein